MDGMKSEQGSHPDLELKFSFLSLMGAKARALVHCLWIIIVVTRVSQTFIIINIE